MFSESSMVALNIWRTLGPITIEKILGNSKKQNIDLDSPLIEFKKVVYDE